MAETRQRCVLKKLAKKKVGLKSTDGQPDSSGATTGDGCASLLPPQLLQKPPANGTWTAPENRNMPPKWASCTNTARGASKVPGRERYVPHIKQDGMVHMCKPSTSVVRQEAEAGHCWVI